MSTRGLYGFKFNGNIKATYCHSDSYPDWLGRNVATFIKSHDVSDMKRFVNDIILKDEDAPYTAEDVKFCANHDFLNDNIAGGKTDWYALLRNLQGRLDRLWDTWKGGNPAYMLEYASFEKSPVCQYVYYINLDDEVLEFRKYGGEWLSIPLKTTRSVDAIVRLMEAHAKQR